MAKEEFIGIPNRAMRRGTHTTSRHCSKTYSRGRATWNWPVGKGFGQPKWRRITETVAE